MDPIQYDSYLKHTDVIIITKMSTTRTSIAGVIVCALLFM